MGSNTNADITERHSVVQFSDIKRINDLEAPLEDEQNPDMTEVSAYNPKGWTGLARKTWKLFCLIAGAFFFATLIAWPLAKLAAHRDVYGTGANFSWLGAYDFVLFLILIPVTLLILMVGYALAAGQRMTGVAEEISASAKRLLRPETEAVDGVKTVGRAVREEVDTLNNHVDDALSRLASAEAMIRQLIGAIDTAGNQIDSGTTGLVDRVKGEREQLIDLTEQMNVEADAFAAAIAEKAKLGIENSETANARIAGAEKELEQRLASLEDIAVKAFDSFTTLTESMKSQEEAMESRAAAIAENTDAITAAHEAIAAESARLEKLIAEQRERADRLAEAIASHGDILETPQAAFEAPEADHSMLADQDLEKIVTFELDEPMPELKTETAAKATPLAADQPTETIHQNRQKKSWSDILKAADTAPSPTHEETTTTPEDQEDALSDTLPSDALNTNIDTPSAPELPNIAAPEDPYEEGAADENDVINLIRDMQDFTKALETRLYGTPQPAAIGRFERGERNLFANLLLRRDESETKTRLQLEVARSNDFSADVYEFLAKFDKLLEPTAGASESLLDDYLGSPLGQVYILIGAAVDYFA